MDLILYQFNTKCRRPLKYFNIKFFAIFSSESKLQDDLFFDIFPEFYGDASDVRKEFEKFFLHWERE